MSQKNLKNIAASIRQKLLNKSKKEMRPFNELLQYYGLERLLYRLSVSEYRDKFFLKGALLFTAWKHSVTRSTADIDLLGKVSNDPANLLKIFRSICVVQVQEDGVRFDASGMTVEPISVDANYQGVRVLLYGYLDTARIRIQVDIGFSDVITPGAEILDYPTLLDLPVPRLNCYTRETAIAEKLQAMVKLDILNSRMKDFYDIWILSRQFEFNGSTLLKAICNTFKQRTTEITPHITSLTETYYGNQDKIAQWKGFLKRSKISDAPADLKEIIADLENFLRPVITHIVQNQDFGDIWKPKLAAWKKE